MVTLPGTIFLGSSPSASKDTRGFFAKGLDVLSSVLLEPTTFFRDPAKAGRIVQQRRADIRAGKKGAATAVIAETLTATAIVASAVLLPGTAVGRGIAGKILVKAAPTTIPKAVALATGTGLLISSKRARDVAVGFIDDPTKLGRGAGALLDKAVAGEDAGTIGGAFKTAGVVGAGIALVAGGVALKKKFTGRKGEEQPITASPLTPKVSTIIPTATDISAVGSDPVVAKPVEKKPVSPGVVVNNVINNIPQGL